MWNWDRRAEHGTRTTIAIAERDERSPQSFQPTTTSAGFNAYLSKPIDVQAFSEIVDKMTGTVA